MNSSDKEQQLLEHIRKQLDQNQAEIDQHTRQQLKQIRQQALTGKPRKGSINRWKLAGLASAFAALAAVLWPSMQLQLTDSSNYSFEDMEIIAGSDSLELYQNIELYQWLLLEDENTG